MKTLAVIAEASSARLGQLAHDGTSISGDSVGMDLVEARRRHGFSDAEIWLQLDGWSNGYVTIRRSNDSDLARSQATRQGESGHLWWTKDPEGLAEWATHEHPWTALHRHVITWKGMTPDKANRITSDWFHEVFGIWPAEREGENPAGPG